MDFIDVINNRRAVNFFDPDNYWIPLLLAVGYFKKDMELAPPKWRKAFEEIVVKFH